MRRINRVSQAKGTTIKDLIDHALGRHGIARQVKAGMLVERMNGFLRDQNPELAQEVRILSEQFGVIRIGMTHRLFQEKIEPYESSFLEIARELSDKEITFHYLLVDSLDDTLRR